MNMSNNNTATATTATFTIPTALPLFVDALTLSLFDRLEVFDSCSYDIATLTPSHVDAEVFSNDPAGGSLRLILRQLQPAAITATIESIPGHWLVQRFSDWLGATYPGVTLPIPFASDQDIDAVAGALLADDARADQTPPAATADQDTTTPEPPAATPPAATADTKSDEFILTHLGERALDEIAKTRRIIAGKKRGASYKNLCELEGLDDSTFRRYRKKYSTYL